METDEDADYVGSSVDVLDLRTHHEDVILRKCVFGEGLNYHMMDSAHALAQRKL